MNCRVEDVFDNMENHLERFDVIVPEQEVNHVADEELPIFLKLCWDSLKNERTLIVHSLNRANPITG